MIEGVVMIFGLRFVRRFAAYAPGAIVAMALLTSPSLAQKAALEKPFLDTNDFYLRSAGFRVKFASDAAGQKVMRDLPPHRMVMHKTANGVRYLFADPKICVCVFVGTTGNLQSYRDIVANPLPGADNVAPDYKTQASALLDDMSNIDNDSLADWLRDYY